LVLVLFVGYCFIIIIVVIVVFVFVNLAPRQESPAQNFFWLFSLRVFFLLYSQYCWVKEHFLDMKLPFLPRKCVLKLKWNPELRLTQFNQMH